MVILHLGVNDIPYASEPATQKVGKARKGKANKPKKAAAPAVQTTGQVAEILEENYGIIGTFANVYGQQIGDAFANSIAGALESVMTGTPINDPYAGATTEIEESMKLFLDLQEMDGASGPRKRGLQVPTKAALDGVNHRLKQKKGAPRPSFIDTGLYQSNLRAWTDEA